MIPKKKQDAVITAYQERDGVGIHIDIDAKSDQNIEDLTWELFQSIYKIHP